LGVDFIPTIKLLVVIMLTDLIVIVAIAIAVIIVGDEDDLSEIS
jgi:hypothetical protein